MPSISASCGCSRAPESVTTTTGMVHLALSSGSTDCSA
ncbi:Uncharacterised protein [Mycobacteroides abscessus subsp. abscessus]|nr:Uncharacterised protein [Mycobacteroides abscessus subsp. abscessus]